VHNFRHLFDLEELHRGSGDHCLWMVGEWEALQEKKRKNGELAELPSPDEEGKEEGGDGEKDKNKDQSSSSSSSSSSKKDEKDKESADKKAEKKIRCMDDLKKALLKLGSDDSNALDIDGVQILHMRFVFKEEYPLVEMVRRSYWYVIGSIKIQIEAIGM
jgi:hypothetical protein